MAVYEMSSLQVWSMPESITYIKLYFISESEASSNPLRQAYFFITTEFLSSPLSTFFHLLPTTALLVDKRAGCEIRSLLQFGKILWL